MADTVDFPDTRCIRATPRAILVRLDDGREEWFPQAVVDDASEVWREGDKGTLVVDARFCERKCIEP